MAIQNVDPQSESMFRTVQLAGEIDLSNAEQFGEGLLAHVSPGAVVSVDCRDLSFVDSRGVAMFVQVHDAAQRCGATVRWLGVQPQTRRVLQITSLDQVLHLDDPPGGA